MAGTLIQLFVVVCGENAMFARRMPFCPFSMDGWQWRTHPRRRWPKLKPMPPPPEASALCTNVCGGFCSCGMPSHKPACFHTDWWHVTNSVSADGISDNSGSDSFPVTANNTPISFSNKKSGDVFIVVVDTIGIQAWNITLMSRDLISVFSFREF